MEKESRPKHKLTVVVKDINLYYIIYLDWDEHKAWPERLEIPSVGITATFVDSKPKYLLYERDFF